MMKRTRVLMLALLVVLFIAGYSISEVTAAPKTGMALEFSATMVSTGSGHTATSKMYAKSGKYRSELGGSSGMYTIVRPDLNKVWTVMAVNKSYMEMTIKKDQESKLPSEKVKGEVSRKVVGTETIDGHPTTKYEVTTKMDDKTMTSYQWWAKDINFPIKSAAVDGSWTVTYKDIKIGNQPDSLFELPAGYTKMTMPAMPNMPGNPGKQGKK
jgi:hypothetical protein